MIFYYKIFNLLKLSSNAKYTNFEIILPLFLELCNLSLQYQNLKLQSPHDFYIGEYVLLKEVRRYFEPARLELGTKKVV